MKAKDHSEIIRVPLGIGGAASSQSIGADAAAPSDAAYGTGALLTAAATAGILGISIKTVRRQIKLGKLPVIRIGSALRISAGDLDRFIADARHVRLSPRNGKSRT